MKLIGGCMCELTAGHKDSNHRCGERLAHILQCTEVEKLSSGSVNTKKEIFQCGTLRKVS